MRSRADKIALAIGLLITTGLAIQLPRLLAPFRDAFSGFGVEIPTLTALYLDKAYLLWLLPVAVLLAWVAWPKQRKPAFATYVIAIGGAALVYGLAIYAMQMPVRAIAAAAAA